MADYEEHTITPDDAAAMQRGDKPYHPGDTEKEVIVDPDEKPAAEAKPEEKPAEQVSETTEEAKDRAPDDDESASEEAAASDEAPSDFGELFQGWTDEFATAGELTDESTKTILDRVFHPDLSEAQKADLLAGFTSGLSASDQMTTLHGYSMVGGQESYDGMVAWAEANLTEAEAKTFNEDATGRDAGRAEAAIKGLHARYQQAGGVATSNEPDLTHDGAAAHGEPPIASRAQLMKIVGSEKYKSDPAYRDRVDQQMGIALRSGKYKTF